MRSTTFAVASALPCNPFISIGSIITSGREFREQVLMLCRDSGLRKRLGTNAYRTMVGEWNPQEAADRLHRFCEGLLAGKVEPETEGPLSPAPLIAPREGYAYTRMYTHDR